MIRATLLTVSVLALLSGPALATDISGNNDNLDSPRQQKVYSKTTTRQSKTVTRDSAYDPMPEETATYRRSTTVTSDRDMRDPEARVYESTTYRSDREPAPRTYERTTTSYDADPYAPRVVERSTIYSEPRTAASSETVSRTTVRSVGDPTYLKFNDGMSTQDYLSLR